MHYTPFDDECYGKKSMQIENCSVLGEGIAVFNQVVTEDITGWMTLNEDLKQDHAFIWCE